MAATLHKFKLVFFVPPSAVNACKAAISVPVRDVSQAQPGTPSAALLAEEQDSSDRAMLPIHMYIGKVGELEEVDEYRIEAICMGRDTAVKAVEALKKAHPYEEPAYEVYKMEDM
ncbi:unnamed protein product [Alternaria alternata]